MTPRVTVSDLSGSHLKDRQQNTLFDEPRLVARINIGGPDEENRYRHVYEHDLLTFGIRAEDVALLNALHLDEVWGHMPEQSYLGLDERFQWLRETHPYSARTIDKESFMRWGSLVHHLTFDRR